jgi:antitoxin (DNA-binding transcriptional repressor) of toxin-antitoxin stability system
MKFLSSRVLRNQPGVVRDLAGDEDLVLTANGKPFAILVGIAEGEFEQTALAIRRARAQLAVSRMRKTAARRGIDRLSPRAIDAEIRAARSARPRR